LRTLVELLTVSFLLSLAAQAQEKPTPLPSRLEALVDAQFKATSCPGLSVAVATQNQIIFSKALGMADLEQDVPLRTDSIHRLGSISKLITGTIIMDLVEQGKLKLDGPVRQYLPELPSSYQKVTLRHLLSHQAGVPGYRDKADIENFAFSSVHYATSREVLKTFMDKPLLFEPGAKIEYSSLGFTILGAAAESVTSHPFQQVASDFFVRHGISGFVLDDPLAIVPKRVRGYLVDPNSKIALADGHSMARDYLAGTAGEITNARAYDISNRYPAGGFDSSSEDLLHFVIAVGTEKVLRRETVADMWTSQNTADGTKSVFGLGWGVSRSTANKMVGMNGEEPTSTTFLRYFPDSGVGIVVLCNSEAPRELPELLNDILRTTLQ